MDRTGHVIHMSETRTRRECFVAAKRQFGKLGMRQEDNVVVNYNWINQLSNTTIWWLDICCLLHRYQLHVSALMAIFRLID